MNWTRRQTLRLMGVAAAFPVTRTALAALPLPEATSTFSMDLLGTEGSITLHDLDRDRAEETLRLCRREVRAIELVLDLNNRHSIISKLNLNGHISKQPALLTELLTFAHEIHQRTQGMFDITIQPLWDLYKQHFWIDRLTAEGLDPERILDALSLVGQDHVIWDGGSIAFARQGMAVSLNGVAQGFITDRITNLLRRAGYNHTFVDLGEIRASGTRPNGKSWQVGLRDFRHLDDISETLDIVDKAVATSGGYGTRFVADGTFHHLIDPTTGRCNRDIASVSVIAPTAVEADALSTALATARLSRFQEIASAERHVQIIAYTTDNRRLAYNI